MNQFAHLFDTYLMRPANSIMHDPFRLHLLEHSRFNEALRNEIPIDVQDEFVELYPKWIASSTLNSFTGLESLPNRFISLGVTQAIDDFVLNMVKQGRTIRTLLGEYPYSREITNWESVDDCIENSILTENDSVIVSCPFSATGDKHPHWDELINTCNKLNIPVFVDCAFFGTCYDVHVDFNQPCIDTVSFSTTKGLNTGNFRTGMVFTKRSNKNCGLDILMKWHHGIHVHTFFAYQLMKEFGPDSIPNYYKNIQKTVCDIYGLTPSKTMHLALGDDTWNHFTRDGVCNRIGMRNAIRDYALKGTVKT